MTAYDGVVSEHGGNVPYPAATRWSYRTRPGNVEFTQPLRLHYEINGSPMSDDFDPAETGAAELWQMWARHYPAADGSVAISWFVDADHTIENAPFQIGQSAEVETFLSYFTVPKHTVTGEPVNWLRLPVGDQCWTPANNTKGGFIQQLTGWKPAPLQPSVNVSQLAAAAGLWLPPGLPVTAG